VHTSHPALTPSLTRRPPSLTLAHPAREVRVFKRHGVGEREGELGADYCAAENDKTLPAMKQISTSWHLPLAVHWSRPCLVGS
jgi:hypothetical protein